MPFNRNLLIILDAGADSQPALQRGRMIAARLNAGITLLADRPPRRAEHQQWIESVAGDIRQQGCGVVVADWRQASLVENVLAVTGDRQCGLVIKSADRSQPLAEVIYTPTDWKLLRYLPVPVLMIRQPDSWQDRPLLAAVDADPDDADHAVLNRHIVRMAKCIADISQSPLHLLSAYPAPMQTAGAEQQVEAKIRGRYRHYCEQLCRQLATEPGHIEVAEGPAESLISTYSRSHNAGLLVMGTVARSGIRGALLGGNTAEAILARLNCDVLTLKPDSPEQILELLATTQDRQAEEKQTDG